MKEVKTYKDIERSTKPFNWKATLERAALTHERFNAFLNQQIEKMNEEKNKND